ncbi:ABC transporter substrate-binding protein [Rhodobacteraceae bacterium B1Z28]|uniref:ABC transporter substrate-binding protein n=1 Tax=Ruegeria haliotis TaxID=2747601 RepID=A0ABX2PVX5_9RHOB|nr:ABC transporter substrate-binding protein [Ruegeria haliotis]NVO58345.1 ABC transporter substrate-binding protein [Ruegeria haliotis]
MLRLCDPRVAFARWCTLMLAMLCGAGSVQAQDQMPNLCERQHVDGAPHIVMVLWRGPTTVEQGVQAYFGNRDLTFNVTCLSANRDSSRFAQLVEQAKELEPDLLYTWGTSATLAAVGTYEEDAAAFPTSQTPVLFTMVSYPVQSKIVRDFDGSGRNMTGSSHTVPLVSQLKAMQAYRDVTRIGMIFNPREDNSVLNMRELGALTEEIGIELVAIPVPLKEGPTDSPGEPGTDVEAGSGEEEVAEGQPDPSALPELIARIAAQDVQFLYIGPDNFVGTNQETIIGEALSYGIPSFTGTELEILDGDALVGLVTPYYNLGLLNGSLIERILLDGEAPEAIPISTLARFTYIVRMNVALRIGVFPPLDILEFARILEGEAE